LAIGIAQAESWSLISSVNSSFGDARGDQLVDSFLADAPNMRRGVFITLIPKRIEFVLESHCGYPHRVRQARFRHGGGGSVAVVLKRKFGIFLRDLSETSSHNANFSPASFLRPYLSFATSWSKNLRKYKTAKSMTRRIFDGTTVCRGMALVWAQKLGQLGQRSLGNWLDDLI
jgi:hypothetical protein